MKMRHAALLAATAGISPLALGQVQRPAFYVWSSGGHPYSGTSPSQVYVDTPDLKAMVRDYNAELSDPGAAAQRVAMEVYTRCKSNDLDHIDTSDVTISFWTFGRDDIGLGTKIPNTTPQAYKGGLDCDNITVRQRNNITHEYNDDPVGDGRYMNSPLRFFREEDRLALPGNLDGDDFLFGFPNVNDGRTYRNPVKLVNAKPTAPLRLWMDSFCAAYVAVQNDPTIVGLPSNAVIPDPTRFYMDNETHNGIAWVYNDNDLWMLYKLASTYNEDDEDPYNYWSNPIYVVPGTGGKTLADLYKDRCEEVDDPVIWPESIFDFDHGILQHSSATDDRNRPFMLWYADVCRQARAAVLKNCFYDVVEEYWPGCKTLNYDDGRTDGAIDSTGWFIDSDGTKVGASYPPREPSNVLIRGWTDPFARLAGKFWDEPTGGTWGVNPMANDATISSPVLYKLAEQQWLGYDEGHFGWGEFVTGAPHECAQQPNLYLSSDWQGTNDWPSTPLVLETNDETSLRLFRHQIESCINSNGFGSEEALVPWASLVHDTRTTPKYFRHLMSMLRSHKIKEVAGFTGLNVATSVAERERAVQAWAETQRVLDEVYAAYVSDYTVEQGAIPSGESATPDPTKLEYVLRDSSGNARTLNIESAIHANPGSANAMTSVVVEFDGLVNSDDRGYFSKLRSDSVGYAVDPVTGAVTNWSYGYVVNLECQLDTEALEDGAYGTVEVYNWAAATEDDAWVQVFIRDSVQDEIHTEYLPRYEEGTYYPFNTPDNTVRLTFDIRPRIKSPNAEVDPKAPIDEFVCPGVGGALRGTMRLRLKHIANNACDTFVSRYDLVQVMPYRFVYEKNGDRFPNTIEFEPEEGDPVPGPGGIGTVIPHGFTPYEYVDLVPGAFPRAERFFKSPVVRRYGGASSLWETSFMIESLSTPAHSSDWNNTSDNVMVGGKWVPAGYDAATEAIPNTRLITSRFNLPSGQQEAVARFTLPIWTNAPAETPGNLGKQPYSVWYWITPTMQWADVTQGMEVSISRDPADLSSQVVVSSRSATPFQAGFYALTLNLEPPANAVAGLGPQERYAVFTGGAHSTSALCPESPLQPGEIIRGNTNSGTTFQYNFRIYPDCDNNGLIDDTNRQCDLSGGGQVCIADVDDGTQTGTPDGGVDVNDILYFLQVFESGHLDADVSSASTPGTPDNAVDINDLLYYLARFELGC